MLYFIIGMLTGSCIGFITAGLCFAAKDDEKVK